MPSRWDHMRETLVKCCTAEQLRRISRAEHAGATSAGCKEDMAAAIVRNRRRMSEGKPNRIGIERDYKRVARGSREWA